jgi:hypothetical protein
VLIADKKRHYDFWSQIDDGESRVRDLHVGRDVAGRSAGGAEAVEDGAGDHQDGDDAEQDCGH